MWTFGFLTSIKQFTSTERCDIISNVKKRLLATIAICLTAASAFPSAMNVYALSSRAADGGYPADFTQTQTFEALSDFAVGGEDGYAFADGNNLYVIDDGVRTSYRMATAVTAVDYADGEFYYSVAGNPSFVYLLPESQQLLPGNVSEHVMQSLEPRFSHGDYSYNLSGGKIIIWDGNESVITLEGPFSNLKLYGDDLYAIKDNKLSKITDKAEELDSKIYDYTDYSPSADVKSAEAKEILKEYSSSPKLVTLTGNSHMTPVDLDDVAGENFVPSGDTRPTVEGENALLLCKTDKVAVISIRGDAYILNPDCVKDYIGTSGITETADGRQASVKVSDGHIYALPYISAATVLEGANLTGGEHITVESKLTSGQFEYGGFYKISTPDGKTGYVPVGYVSEFNFSENPPEKIDDPSPQNEDMIKTVALVLVVVALVLVAVGYLAYVGTSDKKKKNKKRKDEQENEEDKS